jgi:ABC-2 type transport system permease protein
LSLPQWLVDVSPFAHVPSVPVASATPLVVVSAVGIAAVVVAGAAARRRQLVP